MFKRAVLIFTLLVFLAPPSIAWGWELDWRHTNLDGEPSIDWGPSKQEQANQARAAQAQQEKADAAAKAAEENRREAAYRQSRAESRAKVERLRKAAGEKPFHSAQVEGE